MPVGATGSVVSCNESDKSAPRPLRGRAALTMAYTRSYLSFGSGSIEDADFSLDQNVTFERMAFALEADFFIGKFSVSLIAGGVPIGELRTRDRTYTMAPGWLVGAAVSWRVVEEKEKGPYILFNASLGALGSKTAYEDLRGEYYGFDFRFGATAGKTFGGWFSPYLAARVFGGPILWDQGDGTLRLGSDRFHIQPAVGAVLILPEHVDLFVEGNLVGEQGASLGIGWSYF